MATLSQDCKSQSQTSVLFNALQTNVLAANSARVRGNTVMNGNLTIDTNLSVNGNLQVGGNAGALTVTGLQTKSLELDPAPGAGTFTSPLVVTVDAPAGIPVTTQYGVLAQPQGNKFFFKLSAPSGLATNAFIFINPPVPLDPNFAASRIVSLSTFSPRTIGLTPPVYSGSQYQILTLQEAGLPLPSVFIYVATPTGTTTPGLTVGSIGVVIPNPSLDNVYCVSYI